MRGWQARCQLTNLGNHATEEAAALAFNIEARRIGRVDLNVIPPAGDTGDAAVALLSMATAAYTHTVAGSERCKRAGAPTTPAPAQRKTMRLGIDTSAGAVAGGRRGRLVVAAEV